MTVAFTGYRASKMPAPIEQTEVSIKRSLARLLPKLYGRGYRTFQSGMADGFDIWAAEEVLELKKSLPDVKLVAVIPFSGQIQRFSEAWRERYNNILEHADRVVVIAKEYDEGVYLRRNDYLVDNASLIVTYFGGKSGGTKYTLSRARRQKKEIINLLMPTLEIYEYSPHDGE